MTFSSILLTPPQWPRPLEGQVSWLDLSANNSKGLKEHRISFLPLRQGTKDRLHYPQRYGSLHLQAGSEACVYNESARSRMRHRRRTAH